MSPPEELQGYNPSGYLTARSQTPQLVGEVSRQANLLDPIQDFSGQGQMEMAPASSDYSEWDSFFDETLGFNNFAASRNKPFYA